MIIFNSNNFFYPYKDRRKYYPLIDQIYDEILSLMQFFLITLSNVIWQIITTISCLCNGDHHDNKNEGKPRITRMLRLLQFLPPFLRCFEEEKKICMRGWWLFFFSFFLVFSSLSLSFYYCYYHPSLSSSLRFTWYVLFCLSIIYLFIHLSISLN